jgi:hypothetical protein
MTRYVITSAHHAHLGAIGSVIELDGRQHAQTPHAAYLREAGMDASPNKPAVVTVRGKRKQKL